ncbi:hypothetical protein DFO77_1461 [Marinilabilia salmonicolor]|uniref:Uncharacterized protein n=1 Tax=Marinilabilia salmonicolor TaxID=989 RepID=A0A368UIY3_9BACT|nr:hypothetical protein DFO77_1461 [Marinilabilia salmonicolor]
MSSSFFAIKVTAGDRRMQYVGGRWLTKHNTLIILLDLLKMDYPDSEPIFQLGYHLSSLQIQYLTFGRLIFLLSEQDIAFS